MADGSMRGFRTIFGGRGWRVPVLEKVDRMSLTIMEVPINIRGAYSKGGIPLNADAIANVKITSDPNLIGNAIERFLGRDPNEIRRVSKETLEAHLRGVLTRLTPEEVNEDRLKFADELSRESEADLSKLGIHLDTFKITHVNDDVKYLDSTGREMIANVIKAAEIAESDFKREAELAEASNNARGTVTQANVDANIAKLRNDLRKIKADLESQVKSEEERTLAAAREANAKAEQELQGIRAQLEGIRLQCDTVIPAQANQVAQEFHARGDAAIVREKGVASGEALKTMNAAWVDAGADATAIMLIDDLEKILASAAAGISKVKIDNVTMIDSGDGKSLPAYVASYPAMLGSVLDALNTVTGIDVAKIVSGVNQEVK
jgi:flotillin